MKRFLQLLRPPPVPRPPLGPSVTDDPPMLPGDGPLHVAVRHALQSVIDPELGIDIVSLGLVYGLSFEGDIARVEFTMTTPSCPLGEHLRVEAQRALSAVPGVGRADVRLVWEPPWSPARMSKEARRSLGWPA